MKIITETPFNFYVIEVSHTNDVLFINVYMNEALNTSFHLNINNRQKLENLFHNIEDYCWIKFKRLSSDTEFKNNLQNLTEHLYKANFVETEEKGITSLM